jgi:cytochrome P450/CRP-like cAMP-binding protein
MATIAAPSLQTPPLAPHLPIIKHALDLLRDPLALMIRMHREIGPVFRVQAAGREYTVLAGLEANRWFSANADRYLISKPVYQPYIDDLGSPHVLVAMDGEDHRQYRKTLRPGYSRELIAPRLDDMLAALTRSVADFKTGQSVNVTDTMQFLMTQMVGLALGGCPVDHHFEDMKTFGKIFLGAGVGGYIGAMRQLPGYRAARRKMISFFTKNIDHHRKEPPGERRSADLIDLLLGIKLPSGAPLDEADILAHAHTPFTNSLVYMASACGFLLYCLLKNPEALIKVQGEIDELFANGTPNMMSLRRSRWLRAAYLESLRLHPIALSAPRVVAESFEFAGYKIEAGSVTLTANAVCHFLPELFRDPEKFDIDRFLPPRSEHRQPGAFVPFGMDAHTCLAAGIIETVVMITVGKLLHLYEFELDPSDYELNLSVAPFPSPDPKFRVKVSGAHVPAPRKPDEEAEDLLGALLPDIDAETLGELSKRIERLQFGDGALIIKEGDPADALYIIASGHVDVVKEQAGTLARLSVGDHFGEIGLLFDMPRTASVRSSGDVEVLRIDLDLFKELTVRFDLTSSEIAQLVRRRLMVTAVNAALPALNVAEIVQRLPGCEIKTVPAGEVVIQQGDPATTFYVIIQGEVEVTNVAPSGENIHLATLGSGEYFGEIGLLRNRPRTATVQVSPSGPAILVAIDRETFIEFTSQSQETNMMLGYQMVERLLDIMEATE